MRSLIKGLAVAVVVILVLATAAFAYVRMTGLSARQAPGKVEQALARSVRGWSLPAAVKDRPNPVPNTPQTVAEGRDHFADHCATCHANDGSGNTAMGNGMFPRPPDMRLAPTQTLTDGELLYVIENGVRFTGMPGWGDGSSESEDASWRLVHFIRHLPKLTPEDTKQMEALNPKPPAEVRAELEAERARLEGQAAPVKPATVHTHGGKPHKH